MTRSLCIEGEGGDVLVQCAPCGRDVTVVSQPGRLIEVRHQDRTVLQIKAQCEHGHEPWFARAIDRAVAHALGQEKP